MDGEKKRDKYNTPDRIDSLKKKLYSRSDKADGPRRGTLGDNPEHDLPGDWKHNEDEMAEKKKKSVLNMVFWGALIFFLVAFGYAIFSLETGLNTVSPDNIEIKVSGPTEVDAGKMVGLEVAVTNRNDVRMEGATLIAEYPLGTRDPDDTTQELRRTHVDLGTINPGDSIESVLEAIFFGKEGDSKVIELDIEYRIPDSGATFHKDRTYELEIASAPIELDISMPEEIHQGEVFTIKVDIASNADSDLQNMLFVVDYPSGFEFIGSGPEPTFDTDVWLLGGIEAGGDRVLTIQGRLDGQVDDSRAFRFEIGTQSTRNEKIVGTPFAAYTEEVMLRRPLVDLSVRVDGEETQSFSADASSDTRFEIMWRNNTNGSIEDVVVEARLRGNSFDPDSLSIQGGQYRADTQTIVWNPSTLPRLERIGAGEEGSVSFEFETISENDLERPIFDAEMDIDVTFDGESSENVHTVENIEFFVSPR